MTATVVTAASVAALTDLGGVCMELVLESCVRLEMLLMHSLNLGVQLDLGYVVRYRYVVEERWGAAAWQAAGDTRALEQRW